MDAIFKRLTFSGNPADSAAQNGSFFNDLLLVVLLVVCLAYTLKLLEYLIFKVKV
jgi:hypothetical protein